ncbi:MAG: ATPase domain-containing protein [Candidatus Hydrothermarchaeales archaeon]
MIKTGIPKLDDYLHGGIPKGKSICYYTQPGVAGEVFGMQTLISHLEQGGKGLFITTTIEPSMVREEFMDYGWDIERYGDRFAILDAFSGLMGIQSDERYVVDDPGDIQNLNDTISRAIDDFEHGGVVHGSLSQIVDLCGENIDEYLKEWNKNIMLNDSIGIYNFTAWPYPEEILRKIKEELFDCVVDIGGVGGRILFGQYYGIIRANWCEAEKRYVLFRVTKPGGVKVYIPKLLVTGPFNAGKSTFIHSLSTRAVSVDRLGTTVALDHGHVDHMGFSVDLFGTPGQERFDPLLKLLGKEAYGVFVVIDSTKPQDFARAKAMLELIKVHGLPYIIVANKQDLEGALSEKEIREKMQIGEEIKILPVVATEKKGVVEAFETIVNMVVGA